MCRPGLRVFNEKKMVRDNVSIPRDNYIGIAAFDVDMTTDCCGKYEKIREMFKIIRQMNYKIIIITARTSPLYIPLDKMGLNSNFDIYYNSIQQNVPQTKAMQLGKAFDELKNLNSKQTTFLVDDLKCNCIEAEKAGFKSLNSNCSTIEKIIPFAEKLILKKKI